MIDKFGREIRYMRISVTDRCNLRCSYCMPECVNNISHDEILRYEEILKICRAASRIGINRFKITGGEPFVRKGITNLISLLKIEEKIEQVTVTTNGVFLSSHLDDLKNSNIDGINISLNALSNDLYEKITGKDELEKVLQSIDKSVSLGIKTKINCVLLPTNRSEITKIAALAEKYSVDVRFIELMPIGYGNSLNGYSSDEALIVLKGLYPDLSLSFDIRGNGPATYYKSEKLKGQIGIISANTHKFCSSCNRIRLTSEGFLKLCLCYDDGIDLKSAVRKGLSEKEISEIIYNAVYNNKPSAHCFLEPDKITNELKMHQIGG